MLVELGDGSNQCLQIVERLVFFCQLPCESLEDFEVDGKLLDIGEVLFISFGGEGLRKQEIDLVGFQDRHGDDGQGTQVADDALGRFRPCRFGLERPLPEKRNLDVCGSYEWKWLLKRMLTLLEHRDTRKIWVSLDAKGNLYVLGDQS